MRGVRGGSKQPGEIRRSQNWIGGSRPGNAVYVPPPPDKLPQLLGAFEKHIHADDRLPTLVRTYSSRPFTRISMETGGSGAS
jgi:Fic family protein